MHGNSKEEKKLTVNFIENLKNEMTFEKQMRFSRGESRDGTPKESVLLVYVTRMYTSPNCLIFFFDRLQ